MKHEDIKNIIFTNVSSALHAADVNRIIAIADELWDPEFEISGETGWRQSVINKYLLEHGGGGGSVDPEDVIRIITQYLNQRLAGKNGIKITTDQSANTATISIEYFDGGEIIIE